MKKTGGGLFDPKDKYLYFMASSMADAFTFEEYEIAQNILVPLNDIPKTKTEKIKELQYLNLLVDSGIYNLANNLAKAKFMTFTEALSVNPNEIPGFEEYYSKYCEILATTESHIWGYVELDIGGEAIKTELRDRIEKDGLIPIPVWHPLIDSWEYFETLYHQYDRICIGNLSYTSNAQRMRILHKVCEYKATQTDQPWLHALGMTPNPTLYTYEIESCDSSAWVSGLKFATLKVSAGAENFGELNRTFLYNKNKPGDHKRAGLLANYDAYFRERNWLNFKKEAI